MQISRTVPEWLERRRALSGRTLGFVPTMGALHHGHASLIERCRRENDIAAVSIFVNPSQFDNPADLRRYPRTLESDLALLESVGTDHVLIPPASEIYPHGYRFSLEASTLTSAMEGLHRPGFFQGVMTVVLKLLNLVRADRAYFGEKDYQQLRIVTEMAAEFFLPTAIVPCATIREASGLAASSRNALLSAPARQQAAIIYQALTTAATPDLAKTMLEAGGLTVDYIEEHWGRRFAAASLENVRLIDNVPLSTKGAPGASLP